MGQANRASLSENVIGMNDAPATAKAIYSKPYMVWTLVLLVAVHICCYIDRTIVTVLGEAIKRDLELADWQLGVLGGLTFAIFYSIAGIPIARLAERFSRINIISIAIALWSAMTTVCGLTAFYWQLLLARVGVGIGEAGCAPSAHSLLADYFPPQRRATALSIFTMGLPLGIMSGAFIGGWMALHYGWRTAFIVVGLPGVILALLVKLTLREPVRGYSEPGRVVARQAPSLAAVIKVLNKQPCFKHMALGMGLTTMAGQGMGAFGVSFLIRAHHLNHAQAGAAWGLISGLSPAIGTFLGGFLADYFGRRDQRWYNWIPAIGVAIAAPLYFTGFMQTNTSWAIAILFFPGLFHHVYNAPSFATMHNMVEPRMRASTSALLYLIISLIGTGLGPLTVGLASDLIAGHLFASHGMGEFAHLCPGGHAALGATPELASACQTALVGGIRYAIVGVLFVFLWASIHFLLASRTVRQALRSDHAQG